MTCEHCQKGGQIPDLMPYYYEGRHVWLHQKTCSRPWHCARYIERNKK